MTDEDGYYTDPSLIHLNNAVMQRKIKQLGARVDLLSSLVNKVGEQLIQTSQNMRDMHNQIIKLLTGDKSDE